MGVNFEQLLDWINRAVTKLDDSADPDAADLAVEGTELLNDAGYQG